MWRLLVLPLSVIMLVGGLTAAALWRAHSPAERRPSPAALVAIPIGCAALPFIGMVVLSMLPPLFQKSDAELFEEIFGYVPALREDQMLSDDFGRGSSREIFMRAEVAGEQRRRMLAGLSASSYTPRQFEARGAQHGFSWWISSDPNRFDYCKTMRIHEAHGIRGWHEFRIAECLEGGAEFRTHLKDRDVYIVASRRD